MCISNLLCPLYCILFLYKTSQICSYCNYRVPLLPHRAPPDPTEDKGAKKKGGGGVQSPQPPTEDLSNLELDHQLVVQAFNTANAVVFHLVMGELKVLEAAIMEVSKPPSAKLDVEQESKSAEAGKEDKAAGKGKKGKVRKSIEIFLYSYNHFETSKLNLTTGPGACSSSTTGQHLEIALTSV